MFEEITKIIKKQDVGKRLDKFLVENLSEHSRSKLQKMIKEGAVLVNKKKVAPHYFLKIDDEVLLKNVGNENLRSLPPRKLIPNKKIKIPIIFEDENYLVVNKPADAVVHPGEGHPEQDTLVNWLVAYLPDIKDVGPDAMRPGIVHRLDRDASGLMVIAKSQKSYKNLRKQFDESKISKEYTVLVRGVVKDDEGSIELPLGRVKKGFKIVKKEDGRKAITHYKVSKKSKEFTLLDVETETGRMHQIRAHFAEINHPVVGDKIYGDSTKNLDRLFLHASRLGFEDLDGGWREYEVELPEKLKGFLGKIL